MAKVDIKTIANLDNPPTVVAQINYNFAGIQSIIDSLLSRDGKVPNAMQALLDMNANRIVNLPAPVSYTEPARHGDIQQYVDEAHEWADQAEESAEDAEASADEAEEALDELRTLYLGPFPTAPVLGFDGGPLTPGVMYFDTSVSRLFVFALDHVFVNLDSVVVLGNNVIIGYWIGLPVSTFAGLSDVDASDAQIGDVPVYDGDSWVATPLSAENVSYDPDDLSADNVQDAIDEILDRTSLGVYDVSFFVGGAQQNNELLFRIVAVRTFTLPVSLTGSRANARVGPAGATTVLLKKNGTQIGTINFATSATTGTFTFAGAVTFAAGDVLELSAPASADTTIKDIAITISASR